MDVSRFTMWSGFVVGGTLFLAGLYMAVARLQPVGFPISPVIMGFIFAGFGVLRLSRSWLMYKQYRREQRRQALADPPQPE